MSGNAATCCACGTSIRRHHGGLDQVCWECRQDPDVMADVKLRGGRAVRQEMADSSGEDGCLFDPIGGDRG